MWWTPISQMYSVAHLRIYMRWHSEFGVNFPKHRSTRKETLNSTTFYWTQVKSKLSLFLNRDSSAWQIFSSLIQWYSIPQNVDVLTLSLAMNWSSLGNTEQLVHHQHKFHMMTKLKIVDLSSQRICNTCKRLIINSLLCSLSSYTNIKRYEIF